MHDTPQTLPHPGTFDDNTSFYGDTGDSDEQGDGGGDGTKSPPNGVPGF